jgi:hypothetical protein
MNSEDAPVGSDLEWLFDVLWGGATGVRRTPGPTTSGTGYVAIPSARRARAIVPGNRRAARAALTSGGQARSNGSRRARALAARVAGSPLAGAAFRDRFWVNGDDPLRDAVASALGEAPLAFATAVRRPGPFRKPVLQAVTPDGRVVGYAKVAWNAVTATNVRAEHAALVLLADAAPPAPRAPAPVALLDHRGFPVLVTRPMPERLRRYDASDGPPPPPVSRAVASLPFTPGSEHDPIGARLRARFDAARGPALPHVQRALDVLLSGVVERTRMLPAGAWHGDWSAWNLGSVGAQLWAWDWEYCRADVPIGLDLPHFTFQQRFIAGRTPVQIAFTEARASSAAGLSALGYDASARALLQAVHVAEVSLRYLEAEAAGVAANPRFLAGAAEALRAATDALG